LTNVRDVHQETVALLSDAVTDITKRAVEPTLAPFGAELQKTTAALDVRLRTLDDLLDDDRADRQRLARQLSELPGRMADGNDRLRERIEQAAAAIGELRGQADETAAALSRLRALLLGLVLGLALTVLASAATVALAVR
jgi:chromosome segregation ATPase